MSLPSHLDGLSEVRGALTVAPDGKLVSADGAADDAAAAALVVALRSFAAAGDAAHLGALVTTHLKGTTTSIVTGSRTDALLLVNVDPARGTGAVEKAVKAWTQGVAAPPPPRTVVHNGSPTPAPRPAIPPAAAPAGPLPARPPGTSPGLAPPPIPSVAAEPRATPSAGVRDPWALLRRALGRGQLTEAAALKYELTAAANPGRAGCEPVSREDCEHALQALLEGVGSVMAGDGLGGARTLKDLATERQPNLSFRWLALHWSARAAMRSGGIPVARAHVQAALTLARQLDVEARARRRRDAARVRRAHRPALAPRAPARRRGRRGGARATAPHAGRGEGARAHRGDPRQAREPGRRGRVPARARRGPEPALAARAHPHRRERPQVPAGARGPRVDAPAPREVRRGGRNVPRAAIAGALVRRPRVGHARPRLHRERRQDGRIAAACGGGAGRPPRAGRVPGAPAPARPAGERLGDPRAAGVRRQG